MTDRPAIRKLCVDDAEEYREFRLRALRHSPAAFVSTYEEDVDKPLSATVQRLAGRLPDFVLGAYDGRKLVGIAGLAVRPRRQERHKATLFGMAVDPAATGRGIGRALVREVLDLATTTTGLTQVGLTVSEGNVPAERLYRSCGFEVWGREPRAAVVAGHPVAKLHMIHLLDPSGPR